jgi:hypothetical protein
MAADRCCFVTRVCHVAVCFLSFYQSIGLKECMAPFLVCGLPQGLQVPPKELHRAQVWYEKHDWFELYQRTTTKTSYFRKSAAVDSDSEVVGCFIMRRIIQGIDSKLDTKISLVCEIPKSVKMRNQA